MTTIRELLHKYFPKPRIPKPELPRPLLTGCVDFWSY